MENTAICFLVVNKMQELPEISISSAFETTDNDIYIGYIKKDDLPRLPQSERIKLIKLEPLGFISDSEVDYQTFAEDSFYEIVQYKWSLLKEMLSKDYSTVIYSDTDVFWNKSPVAEIEKTFDSQKKINVQIQSFTDSLNQPRLCMGFVAFRNTLETKIFIDMCMKRHRSDALVMEKVGDDDVVTRLYVELERPNWIAELPQTTFPVGRMLKLFARFSFYPGLASPIPFIFHANYVIGLKNKILLIKIFKSKYSENSQMGDLSLASYTILMLKQFKYYLIRFKSSFKRIFHSTK